VDAADSDLALDVIRAAEELLGDVRFGGGWLDRSNDRSPSIGIAAVDPSSEEMHAILSLKLPAGRQISVSLVRYSRAELIGFYKHLVPPAGGTASGYGWDAATNRVVVHLNTLDVRTIDYFNEHIPADAVRFVVEPSAWVAALARSHDGGTPSSA
jgi:hypothetical protein